MPVNLLLLVNEWGTPVQKHLGGIIVAQPPRFLFLKDTNGDDKADVREELTFHFVRLFSFALGIIQLTDQIPEELIDSREFVFLSDNFCSPYEDTLFKVGS